MKHLALIIVTLLSIQSCTNKREVKYSGFNDLVVGSHTINLFENGEFNIELGLGYTSGNFKENGDTILLFYKDKSNWPDKLILKKDRIIAFDNKRELAIKRTDNFLKQKSTYDRHLKMDNSQLSWWKYGSGLNIGDGIDFNNQHYLNNDTIFFNKEPIALVKTRDKRKMTILSLNRKETGYYHKKGS